MILFKNRFNSFISFLCFRLVYLQIPWFMDFGGGPYVLYWASRGTLCAVLSLLVNPLWFTEPPGEPMCFTEPPREPYVHRKWIQKSKQMCPDILGLQMSVKYDFYSMWPKRCRDEVFKSIRNWRTSTDESPRCSGSCRGGDRNSWILFNIYKKQ